MTVNTLDKLQKEALQVTKEIVVKFIEVGRISPANLSELFPSIYGTVLGAISPDRGTPADSQAAGDSQPEDGVAQ